MACVSIKFPELNCPPQYSYVLIYKTCNPPDGNNEPLSPPNEIGNSDPYQVLVQQEFGLDESFRTSRIKVARVKGNYTIALDSYPNFGINADCPPDSVCPTVQFGGPFYYINGLSSTGLPVYYSCPFVWINLEENILPNGDTIPAETILNKLPQNQIQFYIEWGFFKPINYYYPQIMFSTNGLPPTWSQNEINQTETPINFCNIGPEIGTTVYPGASENLPFATFCENNLLPNPFFADLSQIDPEPLADGWQVITGDGGQGWFLEEQIYNYTRWYNFRGESTARLQTDWTPILDQQYVVSFTVDVRTSPTNAPSKIIVNLGNSFEIFEFITPGPKFVSTSINIPLVSTVPLNNSLYFTAVCPFFDENDTIAITNICVVEYNLGCLCYKIGLVNTSTWGTGYFVKVNWTDCNNNSHQVWLTPAQPVVNACVRNNQLEINQGLQDVLNQNYSLENQQINCDTDYCEEQSCYCYSFKIGTNETITYINCDDEPVYVTRINLETYNYNGTNVIWPTSSLPRICAKVIVDSYYTDPNTGNYESRIPSLDQYSPIGAPCPVECEVAPPAPSPTQTPTVTRTNTPTPSVTRTNTPTRTQTPTITPTRTKTPSVTPTRTKTQTPTKTPTRTVTQTPTKTKTPTPTKTPIICYCYTMTNNTAQAQGYGYVNCSTGVNTIGSVQTGSSVTVCARQNTFTASLAIVTGTTCSTVCPPLTPSPTPTNTVTPTKTPTVTPTKTKTPTVTPTQSPIVENRCNLLQIWVPCGGSNNAPTSGPVHVFLYNGPNQFTEINLGVAINWENQASVYPYRWTADITHTIDFSNNTGKMWISVTDTSGNYVIHEWDINITLAGSYNFSVNYVRQINLPSGLKLGKGLTAKDNTTLISSTQTLSNPYSSSPSSIIEIDISNTSVPLDLTNSDITTLFNLPVAGDVFNTSSGNITIDPQSRVDVWGDLVLTEDDKLIIVGKQVVYNQEYSASYLKVLLQYNYLDNQLEFIKEYAASASTGNEMYPAILNGNVVVTIFVQGNCSPGFYFNTVNSVTGEIGQVSAQVGPSGSIVGPFGTSSPKYLAGTNPCINASLTPNIS